MDKKFLYIILASLLFACNNTNKNDVSDSLHKSYYENGKIKETALLVYKEDNIWERTFYDTIGNVFRKGHYYNNIAIDTHYFYKNGILEAFRQYEMIVDEDTQSFVNQVVFLTKSGEIIKEKSNYFSILPYKDTLSIGDSLNVTIVLDAPFYNSGFMHGFFEVEDDTTLLRRIEGSNDTIYYSTLIKKIGRTTIECYLMEYDKYPFEEESNEIKARQMFFDLSYFVKNSN